MRRSAGRTSGSGRAFALAALALVLVGSRPVGGADGSPARTRSGVLAVHTIEGLGLGPVRVGIDIQPANRRNPIRPGRWELVPVAILGSPGFDVLQVDLATLAFGPSRATPSNARSWRARDVNGDGRTDLVTWYRTRETGIASGDSRACLSGATASGTPFEGCDAVATARKKRAGAVAK